MTCRASLSGSACGEASVTFLRRRVSSGISRWSRTSRRSSASRASPSASGAREWARRVELDERRGVLAGELSGGERRRLELARALLGKPRVLVCDEPFAGIDPAGAERMGDLLRELAASGTAVILADHHVAEALRVCDRAVLLVDGRIEAAGDPQAFREHPLVQRRYLGSLDQSGRLPSSPTIAARRRA